MCTSPLQGFLGPGRIFKVSSQKFSSPFGPYSDADKISLPCRKCLECRLAYSREWAARCVHEAQEHEASSFLSLTYDGDHLPFDGSVSRRQMQLFMKKLREHLWRKKRIRIRYLGVAEYGEKRARPHYHFLIFGYDFSDDRVAVGKSRDGKHDLYQSDFLDTIWGQGLARIGSLTFESAAYVARYCLKKQGDFDPRSYDRVHVASGVAVQLEPEIFLMSRGSGIGRAYYDKYKAEIWRHDRIIVDGRPMKPPRRYLLWLKDEDPELYEKIVAARQEAIAKKDTKDFTWPRLEVRSKIRQMSQIRISRPLEVLGPRDMPVTIPCDDLHPSLWQQLRFPARTRTHRSLAEPGFRRRLAPIQSPFLASLPRKTFLPARRLFEKVEEYAREHRMDLDEYLYLRSLGGS